MMVKAHADAKQMVGNYSARLAIALRQLWADLKREAKKVAEKIRLINVRHRSSGFAWKDTICNAVIDNGVMVLAFAKADEYREENNNTTYAYYDVDCAVYTDGRDIKSHGIDWSQVNTVKGETYKFKDVIKKQGFKWDGAAKCWAK